MSTPRATYRLQLRDGVTFADAESALPYLAALGVSHVYLSPILQAAPGSTHGYDVVDPRQVDVELGGEVAFERFCAAAQAAGLGVVLDIVPNHMAIGRARNPWWWDVLANGRASRYARSFRCRMGPSRAPSPGPHPDAHPGRPLRTGPGGGRAAAAAGCGRVRRPATTSNGCRSPCGRWVSCCAPRRRGRRSEELGFLADAVDDLPQVDPGDAAAVARHDRDVRVLRRGWRPSRQSGSSATRSKRWSRRPMRTSRPSTGSWSDRSIGSPGGAPRAGISATAGSST